MKHWYPIKKSLAMPVSWHVFSLFSPFSNFRVSGLSLKSDSFEVNFCARWKTRISFHSSTSGYPISLMPSVKEAAAFFCHLYQNQVAVAAWIYAWIFYSLPLIYISRKMNSWKEMALNLYQVQLLRLCKSETFKTGISGGKWMGVYGMEKKGRIYQAEE